MAVYTTLTKTEIESLLVQFGLPGLLQFQGASSGVENSTYFLTLSTSAQYVLTLFETLSAEALTPYIELMIELSRHGLPVPTPCIDTSGKALQLVANKPALLFPRASGQHIELATPAICYSIGSILAKIHTISLLLSTTKFPILFNPCGLAWMKETLTFVQGSLDPTDIAILKDQISLSADLETRGLPRAVIHGDLFRDNVLLHNDIITAVIDFYNAGQDILLLDLAIAANDWCYSQGNADKQKNVTALLSGYQLNRPLSKPEIASWHECLQVAAARLWLSRLKRVVSSQQGRRAAVKNPDEYKLLLLRHLGPQNPGSR
jgi:homoserine kinase type II